MSLSYGIRMNFSCYMCTHAQNTHLGGAALVLHSHGQVKTRGERLKTLNSDLVVRLYFVVIGGVSECEGEHALLLQVSLCKIRSGQVRRWDHYTGIRNTNLVNTSEAADNDSKTTEISGLESGVLARRALTIVVVANDNPLDPMIAVVGRDSGDASPFAGYLILDIISLTVCGIDSTNQAVFWRQLRLASKVGGTTNISAYGRCSASARGI